MSATKWRHLFANDQLGAIAYANDPHTGALVEEVAFTGGSYRVFGGSVDDSVFRLKRMLDAAFHVRGPALPSHLVDEADRLVGVTLAVLDMILQRADLSRLTEAAGRFGAEVTIPSGERFRRLKAAVALDLEGPDSLDPGAAMALAPLTADQGAFTIKSLDPPHLIDGPLKTRPFLRTTEKLILVNPGVILGSLVHAVVNTFVAGGARSVFAERFRHSVHRSAAASLSRLRLVEEASQPISWESALAISARWRVDADQVCHLLVVPDDFDGYDSRDPYSQWKFPGGVEAVRAACRRFEEDLRKTEPSTRVLHVLLTETLGRSVILGLDGDLGSARNLDLLMTAGDLETLSWIRYGDPQMLFNYAVAHDALVRQTKVVTYGTLDLFREWRAHHDSFYFGDDRKPNMLTVAPSAGAAELRRELHRQRMIHGAPWIDPGALIEVQRSDLESGAPIFAPTERHDQIALLVETPRKIWVAAQLHVAAESTHVAYLLVDAVAYWLWQVSRQPGGRDLLGRLPEHVVVRIKVDAPETWSEWAVRGDGAEQPCIATVSKDGLRLEVPRQMARVFNRSDNLGERQLVLAVLRGITALLRATGTDLSKVEADEKALQRLTDEAAPLGPKKKIVLLSLGMNSIDLRDSPDLPPHRLVQDATVSGILDEIGVHLRTVRGLPEGPIPDADRTAVLRDVVAFLFDRLGAEIRQLSGDAIEAMVGRYERTIFEQATQKFMVATKLACYSDFSRAVEKARQELPALSRLALAQRLVIEHMTAVCPTGKQALTMSKADLLTALSLEIANYAMVSDAIRFRLSDRKMGLLPSGRLGISPDASYDNAQSQFMAQSVASEVEEDIERFPVRWESDVEPGADLRQKVAMLDSAAAEAFGATFTEFKMLTHTLIDIARDQAVVTIKEAELVTKVAALVEWDAVRVASILGDLTLEPRDDFWNPHAPYTQRDVQPWLFNRRLSYLRRPLLRRIRDGEGEIVYGVRHVGHVGPYLMGLCTSGRLMHVRSKAMKTFIDQVRRADTKAFNRRVAELFRANVKLLVDENVDEVLGVKVARANGETLGDLDVLVINQRRRRILVIETKALGVARNPREMDNQLRDIFDTKGHDPSDATRHIERVAWVESHIGLILERYGIQVRGRAAWSVEGMFVLDQDLMTPYLASVPMPVVSARQLVRNQRVGQSGTKS